MTTEQRRDIRRALIALGFHRTGVSRPRDAKGEQYTEQWRHESGERIFVQYAEKTKEILGTVVFESPASDLQIQWGNHDNPNDLLTVGVSYDVVEIEVHSWHTKIELAGFPGKRFNAVNFKWADESVLEKALADWRKARLG